MRSSCVPEWLGVLRDIGYPTDVVVIDFETFFDTGYSMGGDGESLSTVEFIMDDRFEEIAVGVLEINQPFDDYEARTHTWLGEEQVATVIRHLQRQYGENLERCTVVAQNAAFDISILAWRHGIKPPHVIDILGLARHWNSRTRNGLDSLTKRFKLPDKGDTTQFKGATYRQRFKRPKGKKKGPKMPEVMPILSGKLEQDLLDYTNNDVLREWELFTLLLPRFSRPKVEARIMQHTLELFFKPSLATNEKRADEIAEAMDAEIDKVCEQAGHVRKEISGNKSFDRLLEEAITAAGDSPEAYKKMGKKGPMFAIAKDDPEREALLEHEDASVRSLVEARVAVKSWPLHISRVKRIIRQGKPLGLLPVPLKYHGAHTGRWSGGERINLQNLGSRGHELVNAVREILVAPEGHELVIADASQIEARVLAWIADQDDLCRKFANDEEIYCGFAEKVLGYPVRKPRKEGGIPAIEARMKWARNSIGKVGVLGCGYGMGAKKAVTFGKGAFNLPTAEKLVKVYREDNDRIVQFWKDLERAFIYVYKYKNPVEMQHNLRLYSTEECDVVICLPCGRELKYQDVKLEAGKYGDEIRVYNHMEKKWGHVWGGHLTENVVQAMSRDVLAEAFLRLEDAGHHTALHVHDEIIIVTPTGTGQKVLDLAVAELSRRPTWGPDLPLGAEGVISKRYGDH